MVLGSEITMRIIVECGLTREGEFTVLVVVTQEVIKEAAMRDEMTEEGRDRT